MHTSLQRKPNEQAASSRSPKPHVAQPHDLDSTLPINNAIETQTISRKGACACGGRCPACQAKSSNVRVSQPSDASEIEADRIAENIMRAPLGAGTPAANAGTGGNTLQRKALSSSANIPSQSPAHVRDTIGTGGQPLEAPTRHFFEPRLGYDLGNVRVHTDAKAGQSARALDANAYTLGNNVVFGSGQYQPNSETGKRLIAHELAHVAQANASTIHRDTIHRQPAGNGDLAAMEYELHILRMMPVKLPATLVRIAQLEQQSALLRARGVGAPRAQTVACTEADKAVKISQLRNKCLTVITRWRLYKEHVDDAWNREDDQGRRLAAVADWDTYVTQEEFDRLDKNLTYHRKYEKYLDYYAGGGQYERYKAEREAKAEPPTPPVPAESTDAFTALSEMRQIDIDNMQAERDRMFSFTQRPEPPTPAPVTAQSGCHADPYAAKTSGSAMCGQKRPDEATQATMRAMEMPKPDFSEYDKAQRALLDRLNGAHLYWSRTGRFLETAEFSPYEIEKDRIIPVEQRWDLYNRGDSNNLENADFNARFFRSQDEYQAEWQRRQNEYRAKLKACGKSRPSHFKCRDKVMSTYHPGKFQLYDAAARRTYNDIQIAMPVLRYGGPAAGFTFHATHEWLGWSTERSAAAANFVGGVTNIAVAKTQQVFSNRNAGQSITPRDTMTPPSQNVAAAPTRDPIPTPGTKSAPTPNTDPWAGPIGKVDVTNSGAFPPPAPEPPAPVVRPPTTTTTDTPPTTTTTTTTTTVPKDGPMRAPPGGGKRGTYIATGGTQTQTKPPNPVVEVLPRTTVPMTDFEEPPPGHYIKRKPPDAETQRQILAQAGHTTDGRLRDANTGRALNDGEAVWGHRHDYQFKVWRDIAEQLRWTQEQFDEFFRDPNKWQIEYGPTNSGRSFDRVQRQRPVH